MYHLLSGLYKQWTQKEEYFIIILGLDNAGKTVALLLNKTPPASTYLLPRKDPARARQGDIPRRPGSRAGKDRPDRRTQQYRTTTT